MRIHGLAVTTYCTVADTALLAVLLLTPPLAAGSDTHVQYVGGTLGVLSAKTEGRVDTSDQQALWFFGKKTALRIPYDRVNLLEYGQNVNRRYALAVFISPVLVLGKKRKHFVTIGYADEEGRQQAMVLHVDKQHVRALLVSLEARTGREVTYQDEEARKAGKGN